MLVFSLSPPSVSCSWATSSAFDFSCHLWFSDPSFYCALFPSIQVKVSSCLRDISLWCPMFSTSWTCAGLLSRNTLRPSYLCGPFLHNFSEIFFSQLICLLKLFSSACNTPFSHVTLSYLLSYLLWMVLIFHHMNHIDFLLAFLHHLSLSVVASSSSLALPLAPFKASSPSAQFLLFISSKPALAPVGPRCPRPSVLPCQIPTVLEKSSACMLQSCWAVLLQKSPLELSFDSMTTENSTALMPLSIPLTISFPVFPHFSVAVSWLWTVNSSLLLFSACAEPFTVGS